MRKSATGFFSNKIAVDGVESSEATIRLKA